MLFRTHADEHRSTVVPTDVLFVDLPYNSYELGRRFKAAWSYKQLLSPYELHLGFRYMVASLGAAGHTAEIVFPSADPLTTRAHIARVIAEAPPRVLGFTSYEGSLKETLQFIRQLKRLGVPSVICLGGHLATFSYEEILRSGNLIDVIVLGEGERAIVEIVEAIKGERSLATIPGLAYREGERIVTTPRRPIEMDIDRLPCPFVPDTRGQPSDDVPLFLTTSRGCYAHCSFCRSSHFGEAWRSRDPVRVVDEIEAACRRGITTFEMVDDNFLGPGRRGKQRAVAIATEIRRRRLSIRFHASCRVNDVDEPTMRALQEAGLISVSLGVESGVQRMLDTFNKNTTVAQNLAALTLLQRLSIPTLAYVIFFDPYTTLAEARENLQFLQTIRALDTVRFELILFRKLIPISGTTLFERIRRDGLLKGNPLSGHSFRFRDRRVALLADFLETIDLRFESALQHEEFRQIDGMYTLKESFQFVMAARAIDLLASGRGMERDARRRLDGLFRTALREAFGFSPSEPAVFSTQLGKERSRRGETKAQEGV
ncbi:MAG: B12-binding domain-containing radical SAM protein [Solirubrobacterales bacterium]